MSKRLNPYQVLLKDIREFCRGIKFRDKRGMFYYDKKRLHEGWTLDEVYQRVAAAEILGYDVILEARPSGLQMVYIKKIPSIPLEWE